MLAANTGSNLFQLIIVLVIFVIVLFATYYVTKWIAGYQKTQLHNKNFKVIETMKVTNGKYLQLIQVGKEEYFVIGIGKDELTTIGRLSKDQIYEITDDNLSEKSNRFSEVLASFRDKK